MPVHAITPDYKGEVKDRLENFHGNQIVYVGWDHHLMFCAAFGRSLARQSLFFFRLFFFPKESYLGGLRLFLWV